MINCNDILNKVNESECNNYVLLGEKRDLVKLANFMRQLGFTCKIKPLFEYHQIMITKPSK